MNVLWLRIRLQARQLIGIRDVRNASLQRQIEQRREARRR